MLSCERQFHEPKVGYQMNNFRKRYPLAAPIIMTGIAAFAATLLLVDLATAISLFVMYMIVVAVIFGFGMQPRKRAERDRVLIKSAIEGMEQRHRQLRDR